MPLPYLPQVPGGSALGGEGAQGDSGPSKGQEAGRRRARTRARGDSGPSKGQEAGRRRARKAATRARFAQVGEQ
jgi:hypothetical protein